MSKRLYNLFHTFVLLALTIGFFHFTSNASFSADTYSVPQTAEVILTWDPNDPAPDGYRIYQRTEGQPYDYSQPSWTGSGTTGTIYNLDWDTTYSYIVRACAGGLESADSEEVSFVAPSPEPATYTIPVALGDHGSIEPGGPVVVAKGSSQTYAIMPDTGYHLANVIVDGLAKGAISSYTFESVDENHSITANFAVDTYQISATAGANGTITPDTVQDVIHGGRQMYTMTPNRGYHIAQVIVDGKTVGTPTSHSFNNVTKNHTIAVTFALDGFSLTAAAGEGGSIFPAGQITVNRSASQTFTLMADDGYEIQDLVINGQSQGTQGSCTLHDIDTDYAIEASFTPINQVSKVIDDGQTGTSCNGQWSVSGGADPYGSQSLYSRDIGATYSYESEISGSYDIALWWTQYSSRCSDVPVAIYDGTTLLETVTVNQRQNGGQWNFLGTYEFTGQARVVIVSDNSFCSTGVDAVEFTKTDDVDAPGAPTIIDDGQTGTSFSGQWSVSGGADPYGPQSLYSKEVGGTYSYKSSITGPHDIELWWTYMPSRCTAVPVKIYDGITLLDTVTVNQRQDGGQWNFLGTYEFTGQAKVVVVSDDSACSTGVDSIRYSPY